MREIQGRAKLIAAQHEAAQRSQAALYYAVP